MHWRFSVDKLGHYSPTTHRKAASGVAHSDGRGGGAVQVLPSSAPDQRAAGDSGSRKTHDSERGHGTGCGGRNAWGPHVSPLLIEHSPQWNGWKSSGTTVERDLQRRKLRLGSAPATTSFITDWTNTHLERAMVASVHNDAGRHG